MIIIPARLKSSRFDEKILCDINGYPMFVYTALKMSKIDEVCVALDDEKTLKIANDYNIKAILTDKNHESGTDRINQACKILNLKDDEIIINVQADEPFIEEQNIKIFKDFSCKYLQNAFMCSCYKEITDDEANDANLVKVVCDNDDFALYFSRSKIPFEREKFEEKFKGHLGIYSYKVSSLREFCEFKNSSLEKAEKLEQLRVLQNSKKIKMLKIQTNNIGIDTLQDYEKALNKFYKEI